ncbi:MAG: hypothetical protein SFU85_11275 [Candidatus Methylacidiphilales bacterium]|nr:hypothetical protein [Candidatus Methylacidiphilales bacterium]
MIPNAYSAKIAQDTWKEETKKADLSTLRHWSYLSEAGDGVITEEKGKRFLRLKEGAKIQSVNVAAYTDTLNLSGNFTITSPGGSGGFGFIDFSSGLYYYAYLDKSKGRFYLQRGDGDNATVLAEAEAPSTMSGPLQLTADLKTKDRIRLSLLSGSQEILKAEEARPDKMGGTYQIYFGISQDAAVDLFELTAITSR